MNKTRFLYNISLVQSAGEMRGARTHLVRHVVPGVGARVARQHLGDLHHLLARTLLVLGLPRLLGCGHHVGHLGGKYLVKTTKNIWLITKQDLRYERHGLRQYGEEDLGAGGQDWAELGGGDYTGLGLQ